MNDSKDGSGAPTGRSGPSEDHSDCRAHEFARWSRIMLEHEREYLSKYMASVSPYLSNPDNTDLMHDLADIDWFLQQLEVRVNVP